MWTISYRSGNELLAAEVMGNLNDVKDKINILKAKGCCVVGLEDSKGNLYSSADVVVEESVR